MEKSYTFHPIVAQAYSAVHQWLDTQPGVSGFRDIGHKQAAQLLDEPTFISAAAQFNVFFPAHFFKVSKTLDAVVGIETVTEWVRNNPRICIIDVGCGAGTATAALVDTLLQLPHDVGQNSIEIFSLGIDKNIYAIALFNRMMTEIQSRLQNSEDTRVGLLFDYIHQGIPEAILPAIRKLENKMNSAWKQPRIARALVTQVNLVSPLSVNHHRTSEEISELQRLGVPVTTDDGAIDENEFGRAEALSYEQFFSQSKIDNLHVITIGTDGKDGRGYLLGQRVCQMAQAIDEIFSHQKGHRVVDQQCSHLDVMFYNPTDSYWRSQGYICPNNPVSFHYGINHIVNWNNEKDDEWQQVIDLENFRLAWARARANLLSESFYDEVEMRLFEQNLEDNLQRIREQLINYATPLIHPTERVAYYTPKNLTRVRPRGLTRLEEEIIQVAIIQKLGMRVSTEASYAYRIKGQHNRRPSEYLYEYWFFAYQKYIDDAVRAASELGDRGLVLQIDISRFYEKIIQQQLLELTTDGLISESERIRWLLRQIFEKDLEDHQYGQGINQGSIGSGFFANLYLAPIDQIFSGGNSWNARFFRYVDDMILIIPDAEDCREIWKTVSLAAYRLGLRFNRNKRRVYLSPNEFVADNQPDELLNELSQEFELLTEKLWILDPQLRAAFAMAYQRSGEEWWLLLSTYQMCLEYIGVHITQQSLSRKIFKYLFSERARNKKLNGHQQLEFPVLPALLDDQNLIQWADDFELGNENWFARIHVLRQRLVEVFNTSVTDLEGETSKYAQRRLRFSVNRLGLLGLSPISATLATILMHQPWILGDPSRQIEDLALGDQPNIVLELLHHYDNKDDTTSEYLRAILYKSLRFIPHFDEHVVNVMIDCIVNPAASVVERLMASETLLYRRYMNQTDIHEHHRSSLIIAVKTQEFASKRLLKNLLLLIGNGVELAQNSEDPILNNTYRFLLESADRDLFDYSEPDVLRQEFYSGTRPHAGEEDGNAGSP